MANGKGTATVDFGTGNNLATVAVTGQASIDGTAHTEAWMMGDATAAHNAYEHSIAPLTLRCGDIVAGTGFTVYASSTEMSFVGQFIVHWVWST